MANFSKYDRQEYGKSEEELKVETLDSIKKSTAMIKQVVKYKKSELKSLKIHDRINDSANEETYGHYTYCRTLMKRIKFIENVLFAIIAFFIIITAVILVVTFFVNPLSLISFLKTVGLMCLFLFTFFTRVYWANIVFIIFVIINVFVTADISALSIAVFFVLQLYTTYLYRLLRDVAGFPMFSAPASKITEYENERVTQRKQKMISRFKIDTTPLNFNLDDETNFKSENSDFKTKNTDIKNTIMEELNFDDIPDEFNTK
ncbi:hypothetical protein FACS1894132_03040 [Clostridia bacterium]|nr:hypothetical protein FACS1894132_03040 [Clostridia bacterium]